MSIAIWAVSFHGRDRSIIASFRTRRDMSLAGLATSSKAGPHELGPVPCKAGSRERSSPYLHKGLIKGTAGKNVGKNAAIDGKGGKDGGKGAGGENAATDSKGGKDGGKDKGAHGKAGIGKGLSHWRQVVKGEFGIDNERYMLLLYKLTPLDDFVAP